MKKIVLIIVTVFFFLNTNGQEWQSGTDGKLYYNNGKVGIGTADPRYGLLQLGLDGDANGICLYNGSGSTFRIYRMNNIAYFTRAGAEDRGLSLDANGNVGIGISDASYLLDVAKVTRINNVYIGTSSPASGITIRANFPGYTGGWARAFYIANENGSERYIGLGSFGTSTDGVASLNYSYLGKKYNDAYMYFKPSGNIGIGTNNPDSKLTVKGTIHAQEVKVDLDVTAPDYVFEEDYFLPEINEVEEFVKENKHLPGIPKGDQLQKNGLNVAEMDMMLLQKIEELTIYLIDQNKKMEKLEAEIESIKKTNELLKKQLHNSK